VWAPRPRRQDESAAGAARRRLGPAEPGAWKRTSILDRATASAARDHAADARRRALYDFVRAAPSLDPCSPSSTSTAWCSRCSPSSSRARKTCANVFIALGRRRPDSRWGAFTDIRLQKRAAGGEPPGNSSRSVNISFKPGAERVARPGGARDRRGQAGAEPAGEHAGPSSRARARAFSGVAQQPAALDPGRGGDRLQSCWVFCTRATSTRSRSCPR